LIWLDFRNNQPAVQPALRSGGGKRSWQQRQQGHSGRQSRPRSRDPQHAGRHARGQPLARHLRELARQDQRRAPREDRVASVVVFKRAHRGRGEKYLHKAPRSMSRASCRRANGPTNPARKSTRPRSCCSASAANSPCSTPAAPAVSRRLREPAHESAPQGGATGGGRHQVPAAISTTISRLAARLKKPVQIRPLTGELR